MKNVTKRISDFVKYVQSLKGDEKGESHVFFDRLFKAFGHEGYKEAGAELESRIKRVGKKTPIFADLIWKPRVLIEMKKSGENLQKHYQQVFDYWTFAVPDRPRYVVLCNFDEFWIYDFEKQMGEPVDIVKIDDLPKNYTALNFLFPENPPPEFGNDFEVVSRGAADNIANLLNNLIKRGIKRETAQRFVLQLVVAMFSDHIRLLPRNIVYKIVRDCLDHEQSSYDHFGLLFNQMNSEKPALAGKYTNIPFFNGGIFQKIEPIELTKNELELIGGENGVTQKDWSKVNPAIFGTIFQQSMIASERHKFGAHYTSEADILRILVPTIIRPWRERIEKASTLKELNTIRAELSNFKVLDPACGSGNFLYLSFRELVRLEISILTKLRDKFGQKGIDKQSKSISLISPNQFFGIERDSFGIELAKVTLMLAKKLAIDEAIKVLNPYHEDLLENADTALPLDNLDDNFQCSDALFCDWPKIDAIIGNPPFQSKNKIQQELGPAYVTKVRKTFPDVDARADYCVYWFRKAHNHLLPGQRAGLVGTNTVTQNYSRMGSLDYIVNNEGTITEATSSMRWSGEAGVSVSVVNWIKGSSPGKKRLFKQIGNSSSGEWKSLNIDYISSSLSFETDVTQAQPLKANSKIGGCFQGQTHGHENFKISNEEARKFIKSDRKCRKIIHPYLTFSDLTKRADLKTSQSIIDFQNLDRFEAETYQAPFSHIKRNVLPTRKHKAKAERARNESILKDNPNAKVNTHHANFLKKWWQLSYSRTTMIEAISQISRYIVCGKTTNTPVFEFISSDIRPNDTLIVFPFDDDYSFGILQSDIHWHWFENNCSTLVSALRYTSNTVFDTFPWPQNPSIQAMKKVAVAGQELRKLRNSLRKTHNKPLGEFYQKSVIGESTPLSQAHKNLNLAVRNVYGIKKSDNILGFLLKLNLELAQKEAKNVGITGPGFPKSNKSKTNFVSSDCLDIQEK